MICCLLVIIWWLVASRATWKERVFGLLGLAAAFAATVSLVEPLMRGPGTTYGKGQVLLLENASMLLVAAEDGQVHLVRANPKEFVEAGSFKALEGKTWNHPVVVGDKLYVRNSQEAAGIQF